MTIAESTHRDGVRRRLLTAKEVAAAWGLPLTTFYEYARDGRVPGRVKVGRRVLFDCDQLEDFIRAGGATAAEKQ